MPAPLSIIIPTLNAARDIGPTIASLSEGISEGLIAELILSDGGSADEIDEIADEIGAILIVGSPGRGQQLARAAETAKASWFLFLHADTVLPDGWTDAVRSHLKSYPDKAGWFALQFDERSLPARLTAGWANLRSRLFRLPYGDQALLISRVTYKRSGGYRALSVMEDVALARSLKSNLRPLGLRVTTSAEKYRQNGWLRQGSRNLAAATRFLIAG